MWRVIRGLAIRGKVRREVRDKNENKLATEKKLALNIHNNSNRSNIADHRLIHILGL